MCAVIGAYLQQPTKEQIETLKRIFLESQIRGKHATGLSVIKNNKPWSFVTAEPAEVMVEQFEWGSLQSNDTLALIGHCRYSTSDLRYNQPLRTDNIAVVHNGVITQDPPELWDRYGYELETSNDSELLLRAVVNGEEPLVRFPDASVAALELHKGGKMRWYRNGKRPLYTTKVENGYFVTSTKDIALRAGLQNPSRAKPGVVYTPNGSTIIKATKELIHV
jgi:glutamine phosphoribosylpyrophosphate amidotransferase